jgi:hypothetical protein
MAVAEFFFIALGSGAFIFIGTQRNTGENSVNMHVETCSRPVTSKPA